MKKLIIAATALLISVSSFAQFGITGGLTSSNPNIQESVANYKSLNQFHIGVTYKLGLGNILAIQPSLIYNVKGESIEFIEKLQDVNPQYKTGYIELPVQLQAGFGLGDLARIYGIVEPFVGYAVSNKIVWMGNVSDTWDNINSKFEYGIGLGLGVELFKHIQVSARYFWNVGDTYVNGKNVSLADFKAAVMSSKCKGITASLTFLF